MIKSTQRILHETREIYNAIAPDFSQTRSKWWYGFGDFNRYVKPGDRVLDVGCGNGRMAEVSRESKIEYLGVDQSEELIKIARERFGAEPWASFETADVLNLEKYKNQFDLVLCIAVLHHLPSAALRAQAVENLAGALRPGGRLIIYNWNLFCFKWLKLYWPHLLNYRQKWGEYRILNWRDAFIPWKLKNNWQPRYVHSFGRGELKKLLQAAGLEVEGIYPHTNFSEGKFGVGVYYQNKDGQKSSWIQGVNSVVMARKK